jgi:hypothetical protein
MEKYDKWVGYIRQNPIDETGDSKQAQAIRLFKNGTTAENSKKRSLDMSKVSRKC